MPDEFSALGGRLESAARALARLKADLTGLGAHASVQSRANAQKVLPVREGPLQLLFNALEIFPTLVGYLQGRRGSPGFMLLEDEADVQDLLFVSLKPLLPDLVYEQPTKKGATGYSIGDFSVASLKLILEVKYVKDRSDVKVKADEIAEDIWKYTIQTDCQRIVFFVYDPNLLIPDRSAFVDGSSAQLETNGRQIEVQTVIKP